LPGHDHVSPLQGLAALVIADPGRALRSALGWHVAGLSGRLVQDNEAVGLSCKQDVTFGAKNES
jgi:hypothetical protein